MQRVFEADGQKVLGFDTGLDSRAFAQAKIAQFITEPGLIVHTGGPNGDNGSVETWRASGVMEAAAGLPGGNPSMVVWGPAFEGDRLDLLIDDNGQRDGALAAVCLWIKAVLAVKKNNYGGAPLWPGTAIIGGGRAAVFFAPPGLALRCMAVDAAAALASGRYVHPGLAGADAAAFTAAAMLYRVFAGTAPFTAADESVLHQDMRDGNFLPVTLAVPGLDGGLAALVQAALEGTGGGETALPGILAALEGGGQAVPASSLFRDLSDAERLLIEKEKANFIKVKTASVRTKRFIARNTALLLGSLAAAVAAAIVVYSMVKSQALLPTTAGMDPVRVIESYYYSFGELDHQMMEACVVGRAGKDDIGTVVNLFVMNKVRQAYDFSSPPLVISAAEWLERGGGPVDSQVFGVTDLRITMSGEQRAGNREQGEVWYRVDYTFWVPDQADLSPEAEQGAGVFRPPLPYYRSDLVTLVRKKGNWRISEITRSVKGN